MVNGMGDAGGSRGGIIIDENLNSNFSTFKLTLACSGAFTSTSRIRPFSFLAFHL